MKYFKDLRKELPVQQKPCKTCPFAGETPIQLSEKALSGYLDNICGLKGSHLCHSANNKAVCRGGRDIQLRILTSMGMINAPTDEEFNRVLDEVLNE